MRRQFELKGDPDDTQCLLQVVSVYLSMQIPSDKQILRSKQTAAWREAAIHKKYKTYQNPVQMFTGVLSLSDRAVGS